MINQPTSLETLTQMLPIKSCRVSSAKARGEAKKYAYWGAVRYQMRLTHDGLVTNVAMEAASSDRRSLRLAKRDAEELCARENRVMCQRIGHLTEEDAAEVLGSIGTYAPSQHVTARTVGSNQ